MATSFPTGLDSYTTLIDNVTEVLAVHNNDIADAIEAVEAKVGIDGSGVTTTTDHLLSNIPTQDSTVEVTNLNVAFLNGTTSASYFIYRSGDLVISSNASTPSGFTNVSASYEDKFTRISSSTPLVTAGSDTHDHGGSTGSHVLSIAEMPAHTHSYNTVVAPGAGDSGGGLSTVVGQTTGSTGGGSGHVQPITSANNVPAYVQILIYQKT